MHIKCAYDNENPSDIYSQSFIFQPEQNNVKKIAKMALKIV